MSLRNAYILISTLLLCISAGAENVNSGKISDNRDKNMKSKNITVSLLGPAPVSGEKRYGQDAVDYMIKHWEVQINKILADKPDIIILPEACDRFPAHSMEERKEYYRFRGNKIRDFFCKTAKKNNCYIAYSAARKLDDGTYRNSTQLIGRTGKIEGIYNKNYLVPSETNEGGILCGKDAPIFKTDFGTVAFAICFDLNFTELLEKYAIQHPDLIIFSSMYHGAVMQNYWAYHCRSYFVSAVAGDECTVINPVGEQIAHSTNYFSYVTAKFNLDYKVVHLDENWNKLQAAKDKYGQGISILDPGHLGAVLLSSEMQEISASDLIREFSIETWDEYYARSKKHRQNPENIEK